MEDLFIRGLDYIITMNPKRWIIKQGDLWIKEGKIEKVGKNLENVDRARAINGEGLLALPGLINSHMHTTQQLARGLADNVTNPDWIHKRVYPYEAVLTEEDAYISASLACLEMIKTGTTCFAEPGGYHMGAVLEAVKQSGLRAVVSRSTMDLTAPERPIPGRLNEGTDTAVKKAEEFVKRYQGFSEKITPWFSLRIVRVCSDRLCQEIKGLADQYGLGIEIHAGATRTSIERTRKVFGKTDVVRLNDLGILGPNLLAVHMNRLTDPEIEMVRAHDVKVCHCPTTSAMAGDYGSFVGGRFPEMIDQKINVSLGSDAAACSNFNDMFRVMYQTIYFRDIRQNNFIMVPETVLELGTINGARALLMENRIGSIEEGKEADIILIHRNRPDMVPMHNPISNIIHSASGACVDTVIVGGDILMEGGEVKTLDEERILSEVNRVAEVISNKAGLYGLVQPRWPIV